ncbi:MAG TPA: farnesyl diphosphate synthase [Vicinamibacterales bacterium]|nr:farnesyl diphosphate synthase [Vicinamibacterales bacterium]
MTESLADFLRIVRVQVDAALERFLPLPPACPPIVSDAMRYSLFAGGKRLRPTLTLGAADAVARRIAPGSDAQAIALALPTACAIEMIHTYSLIHDDLPAMDNDTLRRGRPTLHTVYGDGIAILAGDGLHAEAFTLLAREPVARTETLLARKLRVLELVGNAAGPGGMVGGQAIDLQAAGQVPTAPVTLDADGLRAMHAKKTGALIRAAAVSGAVMAGADEALLAAVHQYADDLGLCFQIVDDILDVEGSAAQLGKTAGKDAAGAKPTYPALFGLDRSRQMAADCASRARRALAGAGLVDGHLAAIVDWVVSRKN